jgi:hypothetical protein
MLLPYEQTLALGLEKSGVKTSIKGVDAPEGGEVVRRLQAEVRNLNKALLHKGAPNGGKDRGAIKGFNGKCFDCEGHIKRRIAQRREIKGPKTKETRVLTATRRATQRRHALKRRRLIKTSRPTGRGWTTILEGLLTRTNRPTG